MAQRSAKKPELVYNKQNIRKSVEATMRSEDYEEYFNASPPTADIGSTAKEQRATPNTIKFSLETLQTVLEEEGVNDIEFINVSEHSLLYSSTVVIADVKSIRHLYVVAELLSEKVKIFI